MTPIRQLARTPATALLLLAGACLIGIALLPAILAPRIDLSNILSERIQLEALVWLVGAVICFAISLIAAPTLVDGLTRRIEPLHAIAARPLLRNAVGDPGEARPVAAWLVAVGYEALAELILRPAIVATLSAYVAPSNVDGAVAAAFLIIILVTLAGFLRAASALISALTWYVVDRFTSGAAEATPSGRATATEAPAIEATLVAGQAAAAAAPEPPPAAPPEEPAPIPEESGVSPEPIPPEDAAASEPTPREATVAPPPIPRDEAVEPAPSWGIAPIPAEPEPPRVPTPVPAPPPPILPPEPLPAAATYVPVPPVARPVPVLASAPEPRQRAAAIVEAILSDDTTPPVAAAASASAASLGTTGYTRAPRPVPVAAGPAPALDDTDPFRQRLSDDTDPGARLAAPSPKPPPPPPSPPIDLEATR